MGVSLGWQQMTNLAPGINGRVWNDGISRNNANVVNYSFNLSMAVSRTTGYWDYYWYVDMQVGNNVVDGRQVKPYTGWRQVLGGREYFRDQPNLTGSIAVGGRETQIVVRGTFHDSNGNWGWATYWGCPIPTTTSMGVPTATVSNLESTSVTITGKVNGTGNYSTISSWKLNWGTTNRTQYTQTINGNSTSRTWNLDGLQPDTNYLARLTVTNTGGWTETRDFSFRTLEDDIGWIVVDGKPVRAITGRVIFPDGRIRRIRKIRKVEP